MAKREKKGAGRPARRVGERLNKNRTFRVRAQLDEQLIDAAGPAGRSVSEEIELRLEQSFTKQESMLEALDLIYGRENTAVSMVIAELGKAIGMFAPLVAAARSKEEPLTASWLDDPFLFDQFSLALNTLLEGMRPEGEVDAPKNSRIPNLEELVRSLGARQAGAILTGRANPILEKTGWSALVRARLSPTLEKQLFEAARN